MDLSLATALAMRFEGFRSKPYTCPAGVATIGYGTTRYEDGTAVTLQDQTITQERAAELLLLELSRSARSAIRLCPVLATDTRRLNAITDFCYNLGAGRLQTSTLRRKINQQDWPAARTELMRWVRGGGRVLNGLVLRRQAESLLIA